MALHPIKPARFARGNALLLGSVLFLASCAVSAAAGGTAGLATFALLAALVVLLQPRDTRRGPRRSHAVAGC